jgi:hypothetical protein
MVESSILIIYNALMQYGLSSLLIVSLMLLSILWMLAWKGVALWRSANKKHLIWFIANLVTNIFGIFEIFYIFLFSNTEDKKRYRIIHDILLVLIVIFGILTIWKGRNPLFGAPLILFCWFFFISVLQKTVDNRDWVWLIFNILIAPVTVVYYFLKIRRDKIKAGRRKR